MYDEMQHSREISMEKQVKQVKQGCPPVIGVEVVDVEHSAWY
jgi:hypothetical protein